MSSSKSDGKRKREEEIEMGVFDKKKHLQQEQAFARMDPLARAGKDWDKLQQLKMERGQPVHAVLLRHLLRRLRRRSRRETASPSSDALQRAALTLRVCISRAHLP